MTQSNSVKLVLNCSTGEESYVPLTEEEVLQVQKSAREYEEAQAQALESQNRLEEIRQSAKSKLMSGTPLTEEEASSLFLP
jgi:hypothetical protein